MSRLTDVSSEYQEDFLSGKVKTFTMPGGFSPQRAARNWLGSISPYSSRFQLSPGGGVSSCLIVSRAFDARKPDCYKNNFCTPI